MSTIVQLDSSYDLWLSYTWSNNNHGVCGHLYEVIDYYFILKNNFKVGIFLAEDIDWPMLEKTIRFKYNFNEQEIEDVKRNTIFAKRPTLVKGRNILFTDGGVVNTASLTLLFDNILYFACGNKEIKDNTKSNTWILQDDRVYDPVKVNGINYKKKILFDRLKLATQSEDCVLLYATRNCRHLNDWTEFNSYGKHIVAIVNKENNPRTIPGISFLEPPVDNLFEKFSTFVYTPVERKWDCSPRFIAECKYYGKQVIFHNINYWDTDKGLFWRQWDIDNDFSSLFLTEQDDLISIIKNIIC